MTESIRLVSPYINTELFTRIVLFPYQMGNEKYIYKLQNKLSGKGVDVIQSSSDLRIHVSGHPGREDLAQMYKWVKPKALIAVHGETRHINAHVKFAKDKKIKEAIPAKNGHIIEITSKAVIIAGEVESGRLVVDGNYIINRNKSGIFHLGSTDLVHHDDFFKDIINKLGYTKPLFKQVYTTNNDRYLAVLPKDNKLPKHLQIVSDEILMDLEV